MESRYFVALSAGNFVFDVLSEGVLFILSWFHVKFTKVFWEVRRESMDNTRDEKKCEILLF